MTVLARFLAHLMVLAFGIAMVLRAGRLEAEGHLVEARRSVRSGGWLAALGSLVAAAGAGALPSLRLAVAGAMLAAGFASLLAGLSGKPRPTGWAAAVLALTGLVVAVASVR